MKGSDLMPGRGDDDMPFASCVKAGQRKYTSAPSFQLFNLHDVILSVTFFPVDRRLLAYKNKLHPGASSVPAGIIRPVRRKTYGHQGEHHTDRE